MTTVPGPGDRNRFGEAPAEWLLKSWLWEIHTRRATLSGAPNFAFDLCVGRIEDGAIEGLDLSSARIVVNGAEPVRAASVRAFCERFAAHGFDPGAFAPVYGLAESSVGPGFPGARAGAARRLGNRLGDVLTLRRSNH